MFNDKKSLKYQLGTGAFIFALIIMITISILYPNKISGESIQENASINVGNTNFNIEKYYKANNSVYIYLYNPKWATDYTGYNFSYIIEDGNKRIETKELKEYNGFYLIKIPFKLTDEYLRLYIKPKKEESQIVKIFIKQIDIKNKDELNIKDSVIEHLSILIKNNEVEINNNNKMIGNKTNENKNIEQKNKEIESSLVFKETEEKEKLKLSIDENKQQIDTNNKEIENLKNKIIKLENQNKLLYSEIEYIKTGKINIPESEIKNTEKKQNTEETKPKIEITKPVVTQPNTTVTIPATKPQNTQVKPTENESKESITKPNVEIKKPNIVTTKPQNKVQTKPIIKPQIQVTKPQNTKPKEYIFTP